MNHPQGIIIFSLKSSARGAGNGDWKLRNYIPDSTSPEEEMKGLRRKNGRFRAKKVILSLFSVIFEAEKTFFDLQKRKIVP